MREAAAVARWTEVRPEMFDEAIEGELEKYERFRQELEDGERRQEGVLSGIREQNTMYFGFEEGGSVCQGTRACPAVPGPCVSQVSRDSQELDGGDQGMLPVVHTGQRLTLCNDSSTMTFATILGQFKESCKVLGTPPQKDVECDDDCYLILLYSLADFLHSC